jgi:hypothetical protein
VENDNVNKGAKRDLMTMILMNEWLDEIRWSKDYQTSETHSMECAKIKMSQNGVQWFKPIFLAILDVEIEKMVAEGQTWRKSSRNGWSQWHELVNPATQGSTNRRIVVQANPSIMQHLIWKKQNKQTKNSANGYWYGLSGRKLVYWTQCPKFIAPYSSGGEEDSLDVKLKIVKLNR